MRLKTSEIPVLHPSEFMDDEKSAKRLGVYFEIRVDGDALVVTDSLWRESNGYSRPFNVIGIADWHPMIRPMSSLSETDTATWGKTWKLLMIHVLPCEEHPEGFIFWQHFSTMWRYEKC